MRTAILVALLILPPQVQAVVTVEQLQQRLAARDFAALESSLGGLRAGYRPEAAVELEIWNAFRAFGLPAARTEDLQSWLQAFPSSYDARFAAAIHYRRLGWQARGSGFANKTAPARFEDARTHFTAAMQHAQASLALTARPVFSHALMLDIARNLPGAGDADEHYAKALEAEPQSFLLRLIRLDVVQPKWGGSFAAMDEVIRQSREAGLPQASVTLIGARKLAHMAEHEEERDNHRQALMLAEQSVAMQETAFAQIARGRILRKLGNEAAAQSAFERAAQIDPYDRYVHNNLAHGYALAGQRGKALEAYKRSAQAGNEWSANRVGWLLFSGEGGVRRNPREAFDWFMLGARLGDATAMHSLGECYRAGDCGAEIKVDYVQALSWYRKADAYGSEAGTLALAAMHWDGKGLPRDDATAVRLWIRSASSEDAEIRRVAYRNLLHLLDLRRGIPALVGASGYPPFATAMLAAMVLVPLLILVLALRDGVMTLSRRVPDADGPRIIAARGVLWWTAWAIPPLAGLALWIAHALGAIGDFRIVLGLFALLCAPSLMIIFAIVTGDWKVVVDGERLRYSSAGVAQDLAWKDVASAALEDGRIRLTMRSKQVHVIDSAPFGEALWREISARLKL
jgi:TPR repeat protein